MHINVDFNEFRNAFNEGNKDNFSHEGLKALYDYLIEEEESSGISKELDVISLCCSFTEYEDFEEIQVSYNVESIEEVRDNTLVLDICGGGYILADY